MGRVMRHEKVKCTIIGQGKKGCGHVFQLRTGGNDPDIEYAEKSGRPVCPGCGEGTIVDYV